MSKFYRFVFIFLINSFLLLSAQDCICTQEYAPVCASGVTYSNACAAECDGLFDYVLGECLVDPCDCPVSGEPVCQGNTIWPNACFAECQGITDYAPCTTGCVCPDVYEPVCMDGFTFFNACEAECLGIVNYTAGECVSTSFTCEVVAFDTPVVQSLVSTIDCSACGWNLSQYCDGSNIIYGLRTSALISPDGTTTVCSELMLTSYYDVNGVLICDEGGLDAASCGTSLSTGELVFVQDLFDCNMLYTTTVDDCLCPEIYESVCAKGMTYSNACQAECQGIYIYDAGECNPSVYTCELVSLDSPVVQTLVSAIDCTTCGLILFLDWFQVI